jgi:hypothetical protein
MFPYEAGYGSSDMDVRTELNAYDIRAAALRRYLGQERGLHLLHERVAKAAAATRTTQTRPGKHVPGARIVTVTYPGLDYDPEPGNTDVRRTIRLTRTLRMVGKSGEEQLTRDLIPGIEVYRLQSRNEELDSTFALTGLAAMDRHLRGVALPKDTVDVQHLFLGHPSNDPEVQAYVNDTGQFACWLGRAASAVGVPMVLTEVFVPPDVATYDHLQ